MFKRPKLWSVLMLCLVMAALLAACGDNTATAVPAAQAQPTDAMMAKTTGAAMAQTTDAMMAKPTDAMMTKTTDAMMAQTTDAMMVKTTPAAMAQTTDAMMAKTTDAMMAKTTEPAMAMTTNAAMGKMMSLLSGDFSSQGANPVSGKAAIDKAADGKIVLHFENLKAASGQNLYIYLTKTESPSSDTQVKAGFEVGMLKAAQGNQDYQLDGSMDYSQYKSVAIYSKSASAVLGFANLMTSAG